MNKITHTVITGADDRVLVNDIIKLNATYPQCIEWAILYFPEKEGSPRNPSKRWRTDFLDRSKCSKALHLCGKQIFRDILAKNERYEEFMEEAEGYDKFQLNINSRKQIFTPDEVIEIYETLAWEGLHLIFQYHDGSKEVIDTYLSRYATELQMHKVPDVTILFDASKGTGVSPEVWSTPIKINGNPIPFGYAGGLNPNNITEQLHGMYKANQNYSFFIDMESGVRTDNELDLAKVENIILKVELLKHGMIS